MLLLIGFLKELLLECESSDLSLFICSVDISSAFDSVIQAQALTKLLECGVNPHVLNIGMIILTLELS